MRKNKILIENNIDPISLYESRMSQARIFKEIKVIHPLNIQHKNLKKKRNKIVLKRSWTKYLTNFHNCLLNLISKEFQITHHIQLLNLTNNASRILMTLKSLRYNKNYQNIIVYTVGQNYLHKGYNYSWGSTSTTIEFILSTL